MPPICLRFIVVGGGIAGLATAYALTTAGHEVLVVEASDGKAQSRGGLQSPPNMTKILCSWGLHSQLSRITTKCAKFTFYNGNKGTKIGTMNMGEEFLKDLLADFLFVQHQDLLDLFRELVASLDIPVVYNKRVVDITTTPLSSPSSAEGNGATVRVESGETLSGDVVIIADGLDSPLRPLVTGVSNEELVDLQVKHLNVTFMIPVEEVRRHEELHTFLDVTEWNVYMGSGYVLCTNVTHDGKNVMGTMAYTYPHDLRKEDEEWAEHPLDYYRLELDSFDVKARKLLQIPKTVWGRVYYQTELPEDLVCDHSKRVLVGDAARPLNPTGNHRTSMIIEDAQTLGRLFSRIQRRDQISQFLTAYEELRLPRNEYTYNHDRGLHAMMRVQGPGPEQDARDELLTSTMLHGDWDHMEEAVFRQVWGGELEIFANDATEKVDDWWSQWGSLVSKKKRYSSESHPIPNMAAMSLTLTA